MANLGEDMDTVGAPDASQDPRSPKGSKKAVLKHQFSFMMSAESNNNHIQTIDINKDNTNISINIKDDDNNNNQNDETNNNNNNETINNNTDTDKKTITKDTNTGVMEPNSAVLVESQSPVIDVGEPPRASIDNRRMSDIQIIVSQHSSSSSSSEGSDTIKWETAAGDEQGAGSAPPSSPGTSVNPRPTLESKLSVPPAKLGADDCDCSCDCECDCECDCDTDSTDPDSDEIYGTSPREQLGVLRESDEHLYDQQQQRRSPIKRPGHTLEPPRTRSESDLEAEVTFRDFVARREMVTPSTSNESTSSVIIDPANRAAQAGTPQASKLIVDYMSTPSSSQSSAEAIDLPGPPISVVVIRHHNHLATHQIHRDLPLPPPFDKEPQPSTSSATNNTTTINQLPLAITEGHSTSTSGTRNPKLAQLKVDKDTRIYVLRSPSSESSVPDIYIQNARSIAATQEPLQGLKQVTESGEPASLQATGDQLAEDGDAKSKTNNSKEGADSEHAHQPGKHNCKPEGDPHGMLDDMTIHFMGEHFEIAWSELACRIEQKWWKDLGITSWFELGSTTSSTSSSTSDVSKSRPEQPIYELIEEPDRCHHCGESHYRLGIKSKAPDCIEERRKLNKQLKNKYQLFKRRTPEPEDDPSTRPQVELSTLPPAIAANIAGVRDAQTPKASRRKPAIEIFTDLNGSIRSGQLTAILGPSGAGKTTLLNCLTGKQQKGVTGSITVKGANGKNLKLRNIPQKDHLIDNLTVEENLLFASRIKNTQRGFDHVKNVNRVINLLNLDRCRGAKTGKISGGQHKRVSIGQELLANPDILVLDEPTSGLDSLTCFKLVQMLRDLVEKSASNEDMTPMAIIVTIHQPQPKVFNLFHRVYVLANGGRAIYEGSPLESLRTIHRVTGLHPNEAFQGASCHAIDPASFMVEIACEVYGSEPIRLLSEHQREQFDRKLRREARGLAGYNFSPIFEHDIYCDCPSCSSESCIGDANSTAPEDLCTKRLEKRRLKKIKLDREARNKDTTGAKNKVRVRHTRPECPPLARAVDMGPADGAAAQAAEVQHGCATSSNSSSYENHGYDADSSTNSSVLRALALKRAGPRTPPTSLYMSEQLRHTQSADHRGKFWSHFSTLTHRSFLTLRRDRLLTNSRIIFHMLIPLLMAYVYGQDTGKANACPNYEPKIDIRNLTSLIENKRIESMLEELHMSIENVSMFFIIMYAFSAAVLALNALSFPLNMQVLLKESRNGWYSMSSYICAKTVADLPLELLMPSLTMALVYPMTGQPSSYLQWRMLTICLIMTLCSLIAQTQALILGALVMNSVQTAVFVSQASQLPWVILAGFTIRIKRLTEPLQVVSLTSFYRLGCEAITLTRYGYGICPCDPSQITGRPVELEGIPPHIRRLANDFLLNSSDPPGYDTTTAPDPDDFVGDIDSTGSGGGSNNFTNSAVNALAHENATSQALQTIVHQQQPAKDIFQNLADQLSFANSYGVNITSCADVVPDRIRAINLTDDWLVHRIWHLIAMLVFMKFLLFLAVKYSIRFRL